MPDEGVFCPECGAKQEPQQTVVPPVIEDNLFFDLNLKPVDDEEITVFEEPAVVEEAPVCEEIPAPEETPVCEEQLDPDSKRCESCGAVIPLDSRFCPECRARQRDAAPVNIVRKTVDPAQLNRAKEAVQNLIPPQVKGAFQKYKKLIPLAAGGLAILVLALILVLSMMKPRINLNDYITIYAEGYEGYGYVQVEFDRAGFYQDHGKNLVKTLQATDETAKLATSLFGNAEENEIAHTMACEAFLSECVDAHLTNGEMLKKGDVATLRWICKDATALNKYGCKLRYKDIEYTVKSLQEAKTFDPFEGMELVFEGVAPYGRAYMEGEPVSPAAQGMRFDVDPSGDLSNGDNVTVTINSHQDNIVQYCIENYGMVPETLTKEVTVSGLDSYVLQNAQISKDALQTMQQQAQDVYNARMAKNPQEGETLAGFQYVGNYLLVNKDREMFGGYNNRLYLVYKVQMRNQYSNGSNKFDKTTDLYWFINFNDVLVNDKGVTSVDLSAYELPDETIQIDSGIRNGYYGTQSWRYSGYQTLDAMHREVVAVNVETYTCDSTVKAG